MLQIVSLILSLIFCLTGFGSSAAAQTVEQETVAISDSALAMINLPTGARRIKEGNVPAEVQSTLAKLVAAGGGRVRQGDSEVVIWGGSYKKSAGAQMVKKLETALQTAGWEYEIGERNSEFVLFSLFRPAPPRRVLVGFFVPSEDAFIFAVTEMLPSNAASSTSKQMPSSVADNKYAGSSGSGELIGKWWRGNGSGFIDHTGKTQYKAGETFTFEFFPDGTVEYVYDKDVLSILQCRTKKTDKARGKFTINGDSLTINLGMVSSVGSSSCEAKNNFKKTEPASSVTRKFQVRKMDSITRPDNPLILCFNSGDGETCFEKTVE
ncbi:MAG: hypothetical protein ACR2IA_06905 [Pyrinomonadaceae bacterium]